MSGIHKAEISWRNNCTPECTRYGDIYYSPEGGMDESRYVYLEGNGLPEAWSNRSRFVIAELGFGSGLNFFLTWKYWKETRGASARLHYISFEKYPFETSEILKAMSRWPDLALLAEEILPQFPSSIGGFHRIQLTKDNLSLTLIYGDANETLPQLEAKVDAWYLDGFAPAKNPELWNQSLFKEISRCSASRATCATFSSARVVKDALASAGFEYSLEKGFSQKRDMLVGSLNRADDVVVEPPKRVAVIGSGIAGSLSAHALATKGVDVTLFDKGSEVASGASGNAAGIIMPYPTAVPSTMGEFFLCGHEFAWQQIADLSVNYKPIAHSRCGVIRLAVNSQLKNVVSKYSSLGLPDSFLRFISSTEIAQKTSLRVRGDGLWFATAGWVNPIQYCEAAVSTRDNISVRLSTRITELVDETTLVFENGESEQFEAIVLANAFDANELSDLSSMRLSQIRGQLLLAPAIEKTLGLQQVLCHEGYILPAVDGYHVIGASYDRINHGLEEIPEQNIELLEQLSSYVEGIEAGSFQVERSRVGMRATTADKRPYVGLLKPNIYLNLAHGSRGLVSAGISAELLASTIVGDPLPLGKNLVKSVSPVRHNL